MFHNFHVPEAHGDYLRFLRISSDLKSVSTYNMIRHLFGATSSGIATFALRYIARECEDKNPVASNFIVNDFCIDDGITNVTTVKEAVKLIKDATEICRSANLCLHKFVSNSLEVLFTIPQSEVVKEIFIRK